MNNIRENEMSGNLKKDTGFSFQNLLYVRFIVEKRYRVDSVAEKMGIHKDTLYRYVRGENHFPIDKLPRLIEATEDTSFIEYLFQDTKYIVIPKPDKSTLRTMDNLTSLFSSIKRSEK